MAKAAKRSKIKKVSTLNKFRNILKRWFEKYSKYLIGCLGMIVFMIVLIMLVPKKSNKQEIHLKEHKITHQNNLLLFLQQEKPICKATFKCEVSCENSDNFNDFLNDLLKLKTGCQDIYTLKLTNINFEGNIKEGWLKDLKPPVKSLQINSKLLNDIKPKSFSGHPFTQLTILDILNSKIVYLRRDMFIGSSITDFAFSSNNKGDKVIVEKNVFGEISKYLTTLRFSKIISNSEVLHNITGKNVDEYLESLEIFDLSDNEITNIEEYSFNKTVRLTSLYLRNNGLNYIDPRAFRGLDKLKLLYINNNALTILYEGVFCGVNNDAEIYIDYNKFNCNCDLVWFRDYFIKHKKMFSNTRFKCFNWENKDYTEVNFCSDEITTSMDMTTKSEEPASIPEGTTSTSEGTTSDEITTELEEQTTTMLPIETTSIPEGTTSTEITTEHEGHATTMLPPETTSKTEETTSAEITTKHEEQTTTILPTETTSNPKENLFTINCSTAISSNIMFDFDSKEFSHQDFITDGTLTFTRLHHDDEFYYEIVMDENIKPGEYHLIYSKGDGTLKCLTNLESNVILHNLSYGTPYIICFIKKGKTKTKIDDCVSFKTQLQWKDQPFLKNKHKTIVITSLVFGLIIMSGLTCISVFYIVRQNPKLIKGNKRVIMVEKSKFDALLMPKYKEDKSNNVIEIKRMRRNKIVTPPLPPNHPCRSSN